MLQSGWDFRRTWKGTVDVSVWLKAKLKREGRVYLVLQYKDKESKRTIPVDRCLSGSSESILLNGRISLMGTGPLENFFVKLKYEGCDGDVAVEELMLKFPKPTISPQSLKIAV